MINLNHLNSFHLVATHKSFTQAAEIAGISKGVLSKQVKLLEHQLRAQLLLRTTRSVNLTEAGEALYEKSVQIFGLVEAAQKHIADLTQDDIGNIRFSCPTSLGEQLSKDIVQRYCQQMPTVNLQLNFSNAMVNIQQGDFDIAVRAVDTLDDDLVARDLGRIRDAVVIAPTLLATLGEIDHPRELVDKPCILSTHRERWNTWAFISKAGEPLNIAVSGTLAANQYSMQRSYALQGLGIAKVPYYSVKSDIQAGRLIHLFRNFQASTHPLYIVHAKHNHLPKKMRVFKTLIQQWRAEHPDYFI